MKRAPRACHVILARLLRDGGWHAMGDIAATQGGKVRARRALNHLARLELIEMEMHQGRARWRVPLDMSRRGRAALWLFEQIGELAAVA